MQIGISVSQAMEAPREQQQRERRLSLKERYVSLVHGTSGCFVKEVVLPFACITVPALTFIYLNPFLLNGPQITQR